jgi:hypothetical protein
MLLLSLSLNAQEKIIWDYPIKPGMKEWAAFETSEQMVKVCQIPQDVLNAISTKDLIKVCLNYPLFNDYSASNDERKGINLIISQFNGLQELSRRKDMAKELIKAYDNYPVLSHVPKDPASEDYNILRQAFLELILSDSLFLNQINNDNLELLRKVAVNKYADKLNNSEVYSLYSIKKTMLLIAVIMGKQNKTEKQDIINTFIQNYSRLEANTITEMSKIIRR